MKNVMQGMPREYISWSQISSLKWSVESYKQSYIYNKRQDSPYLTLGKAFAEAMEFRDKKVPKYIDVVRRQIPDFPEKEVEMKSDVGGIPILGYYDAMDIKKGLIVEFKTGQKVSPSWRGQLTLYSLLYFQNYNKMPKEIRLYWAKTKKNSNDQIVFSKDDVREFKFYIPLEEVLLFTVEIRKAYKKIKELCEYERMQFGSLPFDK